MVILLMVSSVITLNMNRMNRLIYLILVIAFPLGLFSQTQNVPLLERDITICTNGVTAQSVLTAISQQAGFVFSYSPSVIPEGNVTICIEHQPVRLVLNTLFSGAIDYSIRGKYIILKKSVVKPEQERIVEGYLIDSITGERLTNASIYDKDQMLSAITNQYGYFRIEVPKNVEITKLHLSKQGYTDTLLLTNQKKNSFFNIKLISKQIFEGTSSTVGDILKSPLTDSLKKKAWIPNWLLTQPIRTHVKNVSDTLFKRVQISFLPFISTNKLLTANTANDFSFNILAGYTQEVKKFEAGGLFNIVRKNVKSVQLAGVGNIVGGSVKGIQAAGTFNIVRGDVAKVQLGGVFNIVGGSVTGLQAGGNFNICNTIKGAQLAGIFNYSLAFDGTQISGIWNESRVGDGAQLSGVFNTTKEITGTQVAGITNIAKVVDGTQVAGIVNVSKSIKGIQVAGILNTTSYFDGNQIGFINIADSCSGVPFGFISIVKKGYHKLEFSFDEMRFVNMAFRTGVKYFHNNFLIGTSTYFKNKPVITYSYGIGTSLGNESKLLWDFDISSNSFAQGSNWSSESKLYKIYTGVDWRLSKKSSIAFGLSYNLLHTKTSETDLNGSLYDLVPYTLSNSTSGSSNLKSWIGGKIAIRFF